MADSKPINLLAGLKDLSPKNKPGTKLGIVVESEDLLFDPNNKKLAAAVAQMVKEQLRENLEQGKGPGGEVLPALKASTLERRGNESRQGTRGGQADPRFDDSEFRHRVQNNYTRDYTAPRLGQFTPREGGPRGILSGMLAKSFAARPNKDGKGVTVYVAAKRGRPRPGTVRKGETLSALEVVYGQVPMWTPQAMRTPKIKKAMEDGVKSLLGKSVSELNAAWRGLLRELESAAENLQTIADEAEE